jgi:hypothetical protein
MGFLTTRLHKYSQNDLKLLESWWFWHILGKGTHICWYRKQPDFHQKSTWTLMSQLSPVCRAKLKPSQNKKGRKWCLFLSCKKDTIFGAAGNFFGPSYFETALLCSLCHETPCTWSKMHFISFSYFLPKLSNYQRLKSLEF